jgi:hypothetical protein
VLMHFCARFIDPIEIFKEIWTQSESSKDWQSVKIANKCPQSQSRVKINQYTQWAALEEDCMAICLPTLKTYRFNLTSFDTCYL